MAYSYTPSVNIFRDQDVEVNYLPTTNAKRVADQIASSFKSGLRSFTIIGSYGTGKSSFLWALSNTLRNKKHFFDAGGLENMQVEVVPLVGEFRPSTDFFSQKLLGRDASQEEIFAEIYQRYHQLGKKKGLLVLMIDEFGKLLEYAAKNNPEKELYFLQQLSEFVGNTNSNILLLTTLHQNFESYSFSLNEAQRQEWSKVKGRFKELTFNEPVEQLLLLAGERLSQQEAHTLVKGKVLQVAELFLHSKAFPFNSDFASNLAYKLYPLDLFSASVTALAMQRYGQNERSLFSFLEGTEYTGINGNYDTRTNPFYNLANLYDNLIFNYYSFLNARQNPDFLAWANIRGSLEKAENSLGEHLFADASKLIKTIGLLNIFASQGARLDLPVMSRYADTCLGIENSAVLLQLLSDKQIIFYRNYQKRYIIWEGTDVNIDSELLRADNQVGEIEDIVSLLNRYFSFPAIFAKEYYYQTGTPRIFDFIISKKPIADSTVKNDLDGHINLIFNDKIDIIQVLDFSKKNHEKAILYGVFSQANAIRELLREIEKTKKTIENIPSEDRVAQRELSNIKHHQEVLLNHYIVDSLNSNGNEITWIFNGEQIAIHSKRELNRCLTQICNHVYYGAPAFRSELVNRSKLSSQIHTAKRIYFRHLVNNWGSDDLGFDKDKFPPEKTIYLTLLKENGLVPNPQDLFSSISISEGSSFKMLWGHSEHFLHNAQKHRLPLIEFYESLTKAPFKLKQGLIDFWVPTFLFLKRDEFALFSNGIYIPELREETLELLAKVPKDFSIKAFDVAGIRLDIFNHYRTFLNQPTKESIDNHSFIETIRPFLTFFRGLPEYAKNTNQLQKESIAIRKAISHATDPEKTFFEDFPNALGLTLKQLQQSSESLEDYIHRLQNAIREIRSCYDELINRFELFITEDVIYENLPFEDYKLKLKARFAGIKVHRLLPHHKVFLTRISSELDDRKAWLSSIAQAVIGKTLENLRDEEEPLLHDKFKTLILELDTLAQLSQKNVDETKEDALSLEITNFEEIEKKVVRFPKQKKAEISRIEEELRAHLSKDKTLNIAALANLLKELLKK